MILLQTLLPGYTSASHSAPWPSWCAGCCSGLGRCCWLLEQQGSDRRGFWWSTTLTSPSPRPETGCGSWWKRKGGNSNELPLPCGNSCTRSCVRTYPSSGLVRCFARLVAVVWIGLAFAKTWQSFVKSVPRWMLLLVASVSLKGTSMVDSKLDPLSTCIGTTEKQHLATTP